MLRAAPGSNRVRSRVRDDLGIEVVLPDRQPVAGLDVLACDSRTDHLGQPVVVQRGEAKAPLDLIAQALGPRLCAEDPDARRALRRVEALARKLVGDHQRVGRRAHEDAGLEVAHQLHLPLGHAPAHRDDGRAQRLGAVVRAQAPGEKAVAVGDVNDVGRSPARGADRTRHHRCPGIDVLLRVADDGGLAGGAARGMHAHDSVHGHGEHAEGVIRAQVGFGGERKLRQVCEIF